MQNWFTTQVVSGDLEYKTKCISKIEDACEHALNDPSVLAFVVRENDSFGVVSEYGECQECHNKHRQEADDEEVTCHDCNQQVKRRNTISWKWYDFYAPQGDEPMIICDTCSIKDRHKQRVKRDQEEYNAEMGFDDDLND